MSFGCHPRYLLVVGVHVRIKICVQKLKRNFSGHILPLQLAHVIIMILYLITIMLVTLSGINAVFVTLIWMGKIVNKNVQIVGILAQTFYQNVVSIRVHLLHYCLDRICRRLVLFMMILELILSF